jgi:phosphatidylglycerophosphatase A
MSEPGHGLPEPVEPAPDPHRRSPDGWAGVAAAAPRRPDIAFLVAHPAHFVALGGGAGLVRRGPGTAGTALAWVLFALLDPWLTELHWLVLAATGGLVGAWASRRTGKALGCSDPGSIVIDEIIAFWLVLAMLPEDRTSFGMQAVAFALFRFFDIVKPPPIRWLDTRVRGGLGVMLDDLMAAFYSLLVLTLWVRFS